MYKVMLVGVMLMLGGQVAHADTMREFQDKTNICQAMLIAAGPLVDMKLHEMHMKSMDASPQGYITGDVMDKEEYKINIHMYQFQNAFHFQHQADPEVCRQQVLNYVHWILDAVTRVEALR